MSTESSGKPDAWKLARPVWGWGRGEIPRPTPRADVASMPRNSLDSKPSAWQAQSGGQVGQTGKAVNDDDVDDGWVMECTQKNAKESPRGSRWRGLAQTATMLRTTRRLVAAHCGMGEN